MAQTSGAGLGQRLIRGRSRGPEEAADPERGFEFGMGTALAPVRGGDDVPKGA